MKSELLSLGYITEEDVKKIEEEQSHQAKLKHLAMTPNLFGLMPPAPVGAGRYVTLDRPEFGETAVRMGIIDAPRYTIAKFVSQTIAKFVSQSSRGKSTSERSKILSEVIFRRNGLSTEFVVQENPPDLLIEDKNGLYWQDLGEAHGYCLYGWILHPDIEVEKCDFDGFEAKPEDFKKLFNRRSIRSIDRPFSPSIGDSYYDN